MIRQGKLKDFIKQTNIEKKHQKHKDSKEKYKAPIQIKTIFEGLSTEAMSSRAIKQQVREVMHTNYPQ